MRYEAIYARQSIDKADSISIESQIEICEREVGKHYKVYSDKGYSGKNTDRPELANLMHDIRSNKVSKVIVYRLDRISRSVLDFSSMIQIFQTHDVEFVSTMEKFDTGSPIGNAMLMIVMVFAQLERETIQQRIIDAYKSRSEKGFYMGGRIPYGYTLESVTIDGVRTKMYAPVEEELRWVRKMYELYAHPRTSFGDVVSLLTESGVKSRSGKDFTRQYVRDIIINPIYVKADVALYNFFHSNGVRFVNPQSDFIGINGAYLYSDVNRRKAKSTSLEGLLLVLAPHEGVIDSTTWLRCRKKCMNNAAIAKPMRAKATWLAGKLKCGKCGYALIAKKETYLSVRKGENVTKRYYLCSHRYAAHACSFPSLNADVVDEIVLIEMKKKVEEFRSFKIKQDSENMLKIAELQSRVMEIDDEIKSLLEKIVSATPTVMQYINERVETLDAEKLKMSDEINALMDGTATANIVDLEKAMGDWDRFSIEDKMAIVDCLIESIYAQPDEITIKWKI